MNIENTNPNFLIIGAAKCGTTSLYHYLRQHPEVYMSPIKEPNHFSTDILPSEFSSEYKLYERSKQLNVAEYVKGDMKTEQWGAYVHDEHIYNQLFKFASGYKARGEISNSYLYSGVAARNIFEKHPDMKIVAILRQPAERAYSHYLANLRDGRTTLSFRDEVQFDDAKTRHGWGISHLYYELGLYAEQIERFQKLFPADQVRIYLFDDLKTDNKALTQDLFRFLGIETETAIDYKEKFNEARIPKNATLIKTITQTGLKRKIFRALPESLKENIKSLFFKKDPVPKMSSADREWMTSRYKNEIIRLQGLLQRDLTTWLK
jgi:hypothetical protein